MELNYNPENDTVSWVNPDTNIEVKVVLKEFMEGLPQNIEIVRLHYLLSMVHELRKQKLRNSGDYHAHVLSLMAKESKAREEQHKCVEEGDLRKAKAYADLVRSIVYEKNTSNELRHNNRVMGIEEGKLMAMLAKLEV